MRIPVLPAWLLASAILVACGDNGTGPTRSGNGGGLTLVAGFSLTDTVTAQPIQALVVEVRNSDGTHATGAVVRFQALPPDTTTHAFTPSMYVAPLGGTFFGTFVSDTADARGRAGVLLEFGTIAGPGLIQITVPEFGIRDTATYTVLPGNAAAVRAFPRDTALYVGASFQARGAVVDRWGNPRSDPVSYSAASPGIAVTSSGRVSATSVARAGYVVGGAGVSDSGWVSVVPQGTLVTLRVDPYNSTLALVTFNLDGSGYKQITTVNEGSLGVGWTPSATGLVFPFLVTGDGVRLYTTDLDGIARRLITAPPAGLQSEAWPQYSSNGLVYFSGVFNGANYALWQAATSGSNAQQIYSDPSGIAWRASPSPDGTRLAFVNASSSPSGIQVYTLASATVSSWSVVGQVPRWAPNAELIAFVAPYGGPIYVMNSDGTGGHQVSATGRTYLEDTFSWSPDGTWLVARGSQTIELINVATAQTLPLGFTSNMQQPLWKP